MPARHSPGASSAPGSAGSSSAYAATRRRNLTIPLRALWGPAATLDVMHPALKALGGLDELDAMLAASGDRPLLLLTQSQLRHTRRGARRAGRPLRRTSCRCDLRDSDCPDPPRRLERGHEQAWRAARNAASSACPRGTGVLERVAFSCHGRCRGRSDPQFPADGVVAADPPNRITRCAFPRRKGCAVRERGHRSTPCQVQADTRTVGLSPDSLGIPP